MRNEYRFAEWLLRWVTPPHHAAALVGDLLEEDGHRRRLWFWTSVGRTAVALLWLNLSALVRRIAGLRGLPDIMGADMSVARTDHGTVRDRLWHHKWLILVTTVLFTAITSAVSYLVPVRYQSEATIMIVPQQLGHAAEPAGLPLRWWTPTSLLQLQQNVLTGTRLERLIDEFDLYAHERQSLVMEEVVRRMRRDVSIVAMGPTTNDSGSEMLQVGYAYDEPRGAMMVATRLASMLVDEALKNGERSAETVLKLFSGEVNQAKARLEVFEQELLEKASSDGQPSRADLAELEVLEGQLRMLVARREEARLAFNVQRNQIGDQLRVIDSARIPDGPVTPTRLQYNFAGASVGLGLGLMLAFSRGPKRLRQTPHAAS